MKRELLNSQLIYNYDVDEEFNIDTLILKDFVRCGKTVNNILEIGAGAGAISLYLSSIPKITITAIEIQQTRYERLVENIQINKLEDKIIPIFGDVKTYAFSSSFDLIVTNPPFYKISKNSKSKSLSRRIAKEEICLNLEQLSLTIKRNLKELGVVFLIYPTSRLIELINCFTQNRLTIKRLRFVSPRVGTSPNRILVEAVKGAKDELKMESTLYLYNDDNSISDELKRIYGDKV